METNKLQNTVHEYSSRDLLKNTDISWLNDVTTPFDKCQNFDVNVLNIIDEYSYDSQESCLKLSDHCPHYFMKFSLLSHLHDPYSILYNIGYIVQTQSSEVVMRFLEFCHQISFNQECVAGFKFLEDYYELHADWESYDDSDEKYEDNEYASMKLKDHDEEESDLNKPTAGWGSCDNSDEKYDEEESDSPVDLEMYDDSNEEYEYTPTLKSTYDDEFLKYSVVSVELMKRMFKVIQPSTRAKFDPYYFHYLSSKEVWNFLIDHYYEEEEEVSTIWCRFYLQSYFFTMDKDWLIDVPRVVENHMKINGTTDFICFCEEVYREVVTLDHSAIVQSSTLCYFFENFVPENNNDFELIVKHATLSGMIGYLAKTQEYIGWNLALGPNMEQAALFNKTFMHSYKKLQTYNAWRYTKTLTNLSTLIQCSNSEASIDNVLSSLV